MPPPHETGGRSWRDYHKRAGPLPADIPLRIAQEIKGHGSKVLLLGITRDLSRLGSDLTAIDWCQAQIDNVWIGDRPDRRAVYADWRYMDLQPSSFTAAIGDGSLSTLTWPTDYKLTLDRLAKVLVPGGLLVVRCFVRCDAMETLESVERDILAGRLQSFRAGKWRLAFALAENVNLPVTEIHAAFERIFPDRKKLAATTGWDRASIDTIDAYLGSDLVFSFPRRDELTVLFAEYFDDVRFVSSGNYPMAERYPIVVAERRA